MKICCVPSNYEHKFVFGDFARLISSTPSCNPRRGPSSREIFTFNVKIVFGKRMPVYFSFLLTIDTISNGNSRRKASALLLYVNAPINKIFVFLQLKTSCLIMKTFLLSHYKTDKNFSRFVVQFHSNNSHVILSSFTFPHFLIYFYFDRLFVNDFSMNWYELLNVQTGQTSPKRQ